MLELRETQIPLSLRIYLAYFQNNLKRKKTTKIIKSDSSFKKAFYYCFLISSDEEKDEPEDDDDEDLALIHFRAKEKDQDEVTPRKPRSKNASVLTQDGPNRTQAKEETIYDWFWNTKKAKTITMTVEDERPTDDDISVASAELAQLREHEKAANTQA